CFWDPSLHKTKTIGTLMEADKARFFKNQISSILIIVPKACFYSFGEGPGSVLFLGYFRP
ncbi:MAG TPA: hypothetical protein VFR02_07030, partial [bacterium]|nr:hypothetical protein [bacterium]